MSNRKGRKQMLVRQLLFTIIAFFLFAYIFFKMIKNNDTSYVMVLILQAIGIAINFIEFLLSVELHIILKIIMYVFAIVIPIIVLLLEKRNIIC